MDQKPAEEVPLQEHRRWSYSTTGSQLQFPETDAEDAQSHGLPDEAQSHEPAEEIQNGPPETAAAMPKEEPSSPKTEVPSATTQPAAAAPKVQPSKPASSTSNKDADDDLYVDPGVQPAPAQQSQSKWMKRLRRACAPRGNGEYKVPMEIVKDFKDLDKRNHVFKIFEKCGYDPVAQLHLIYLLQIVWPCRAAGCFHSQNYENLRRDSRKHCGDRV